MSGGHDDSRYLQWQIDDAARYVKSYIAEQPRKTSDGEIIPANSKILNSIYRNIAARLEQLGAMYESIDYCEAGDASEDNVLVSYWNLGFATTKRERAAILKRLEELSQESRWYSYTVWSDTGKPIGEHSMRYRGGYEIVKIEFRYYDDDGHEQLIVFPSWEAYESTITTAHAQHDKPRITYPLVDGKLTIKYE
ncbi:MAG: hypothetical protein LBR39_04875 [Coriobacteriales bacterium]|nr:hypothetical protein [Coriobacteriales bacterium]